METIKTICLALISVLSIFFCGLISLCGILAMLHRVVQAMLPADYAVRHRYLSIGITFLLFGLLCLFVVYPFAEHIKRGYEARSLENQPICKGLVLLGIVAFICWCVKVWVRLKHCDTHQEIERSPKFNKPKYILRLWRTNEDGCRVYVDHMPLEEWVEAGVFCDRLLQNNISVQELTGEHVGYTYSYSLSAEKYNPHTDRHETFWSPTIAEMHGLIDNALISIKSSPEYIAYLVIPDLQGTTVLNSDYAPVVMAARNLLIFALYATANHTSSTIQARLEAVQGFLESVNPHECSDCDELIQEKAKADSSVALDKTAWKYFTEFKDSGADIPSSIFYLNDAIRSYENKCADQKLRHASHF